MSSVLAVKRKESRLEVIVLSIKIHDELIDIMRRNFGIRDIDNYVRVQYAHGCIKREDFENYHFIVREAKMNIDNFASLMTSDLRAAKSIYPTYIYECDQKRGYQNSAIANCERLKGELQRVVNRLNVDINIYGPVFKDINREIELIKKWRQGDNKLRMQCKG